MKERIINMPHNWVLRISLSFLRCATGRAGSPRAARSQPPEESFLSLMSPSGLPFHHAAGRYLSQSQGGLRCRRGYPVSCRRRCPKPSDPAPLSSGPGRGWREAHSREDDVELAGWRGLILGGGHGSHRAEVEIGDRIPRALWMPIHRSSSVARGDPEERHDRAAVALVGGYALLDSSVIPSWRRSSTSPASSISG